MHCLEHILLVTSVAVDEDEISKAELVRLLAGLATLARDYIPANGTEPTLILRLNKMFDRFEHLMQRETV